MSNTRKGSSKDIKEDVVDAAASSGTETEEEIVVKQKKKRIKKLHIEIPEDDVEDAVEADFKLETDVASLTTSATLEPIPEREFAAQDYDHLTENEHLRFLNNSKKIGHAVFVKDAKGDEYATQYAIPQDGKEDVPVVRPLVNIESIYRYGKRVYRALTPGGTRMYATRSLDAEFKDGTTSDAATQIMRIGYFSPSAKEPKEPFWGTTKPTPLFKENLSKSAKKELDEELKEIGVHTKSGEMVVHGPSVRERDRVKTRKPDQNTVMGKESAKNTYAHFLESMTSELHPDFKKRLKRAIEAPLRELFKSNYRPEWLHGKGFGLTPISSNPQVASNLGAAPKWANTEMMVLERIAKWFALNRPASFIKIKPLFEMLLDSELIKSIKFEVSIQEKERFIKFLQQIDPFLEYPLFRHGSDIAQGTALTYALLQGIPPMSHQKVANGDWGGSFTSSLPAAQRPLVGWSGQVITSPITSLMPAPATPAGHFYPSSSLSSLSSLPLSSSSSSSSSSSVVPLEEKHKKPKAEMPTHLKFEKSIVEISTTRQEPEYDEPWRGTHISSCRGSGLVIEHAGKKYILTNGHVVENSVLLRVRLANEVEKYEAERFCVSYQSDLALIEVSDPEFLAKAKPVEIGSMVNIRDEVATIGFPVGGDEISVTEGVVSRIEVGDYAQSGLGMLQVQVDSAINHGNSGGPVFSNDKVIGVAFQGDFRGESLGYIIPVPIINHFLKEAFSGKEYRGFPIIPVTFQTLENPSLRTHYGMAPNQSGIRIKKINNLTDAYSKLRPDDILLEIDGLSVSNRGTVNIPGVGNCIDILHVQHMKYIGDTIRLKVLRKNEATKAMETLDIDVILDHVPRETEKVPQTEWDKMPTYFIASGISFQPVTRNYLEGEGAELEEVFVLEEGCELAEVPQKVPGEQFVVINKIFDCKETEGYNDFLREIISEVNGKKINNITDVVIAMENNKEPMHVIMTSSKDKLVVKNMTPEEHNKLLRKYKIKSDRSEDLLEAPAAVVSASLAKVTKPVTFFSPPKPASTDLAVKKGRKRVHQEECKTGKEENEKEPTLGELTGYKTYMRGLDRMEALYKHHPDIVKEKTKEYKEARAEERAEERAKKRAKEYEDDSEKDSDYKSESDHEDEGDSEVTMSQKSEYSEEESVKSPVFKSHRRIGLFHNRHADASSTHAKHKKHEKDEEHVHMKRHRKVG